MASVTISTSSEAEVNQEKSVSAAKTKKPTYCAGHQQQITSMTFNHSGTRLATCSWDSTCMLWQVLPGEQREEEELSDKHATTKGDALTLVLLQIFPVHEEGASFASFTFDDQQLITVGECVVKVWDAGACSFSPVSHADDREEIARLRTEWEAAVPFSLCVQRSMDLLAFDETLTALVGNHEWQYFREHGDQGAPLRLLYPVCGRSDAGAIREEQTPQSSENHATLEDSSSHAARDGSDTASTSLQETPDSFPSPMDANNRDQDGAGDEILCGESSARELGGSDATECVVNEGESKTEGAGSLGLPAEETERLAQYYNQLAAFDFEVLLNPTIPFRSQCDSKKNHGDGNAQLINASQRSSAAKELVWKPLRPDADGKLIQTFSATNANGTFSAHTSTITCCAVAKPLGLVVTVSLDKCIKFWSLEHGNVVETIREAHAAPITCCALTASSSPATIATAKESLLATGGKDNLVKVWRRREHPASSTECVHSFSGHYDAITCCIFDPSGVFLVTTGDDTNVLAWRVVPSCPDAPKQPTLVSVDMSAIAISWDEPLANGSPILHYVVRTEQVSSLVVGGYDIAGIQETQVPAKYTTKTIDKLQPGIQYTLQVAAVNAVRS